MDILKFPQVICSLTTLEKIPCSLGVDMFIYKTRNLDQRFS